MSLKNEVQQLHQQLLEAKTQRRSGSMNGPLGDDDYEDVQSKYSSVSRKSESTDPVSIFSSWFRRSRNHFLFSIFAGESNKLIADYRYKLQKAEQEIASLQASLARSETQVIRYKSTADESEKAEAELKIERRKLQREVRFQQHLYLWFA